MFVRCCPIRQFFVDGEKEELKLYTFCDIHETPRQGTLESWSESDLAKETGVCERTQVDGRIRKVQTGASVPSTWKVELSA